MGNGSSFSPEVKERAVRLVSTRSKETVQPGLRSFRWQRRSAARPRRSGADNGRQNGTPVHGKG